jgi:ferritin-like metal-binding protein YciE
VRFQAISAHSLRTWAQQLGDEQAAKLLGETLEEEKEADERLTEIAESSVNAKAERTAHAQTTSRH